MFIDQEDRTYYTILLLKDTASSREIRHEYIFASKKWRLELLAEDTGKTPEEAHRLIDEAYVVLGDPVRRAAYDVSIGLTIDSLANSIGKDALWGRAWGVAFGLLAFWFAAWSKNLARFMGENFAPGFFEKQICKESDCLEWSNKLTSSDPTWNWILSHYGWPALALVVTTVLIAIFGSMLVNLLAGQIIARLRVSGYSDTYARIGIWFFVAVTPIALFLLILLLAASGSGA
jgi:hypothetical protein